MMRRVEQVLKTILLHLNLQEQFLKSRLICKAFYCCSDSCADIVKLWLLFIVVAAVIIIIIIVDSL